MVKKPLISYLFTKFDQIDTLLNFKNNYLKYDSGYSHDLLICFKLFKKEDLSKIKENLKELNYICFIDEETNNDYDFGSYKRIAKKYKDRDIFYMNSHSYPICQEWLKKLMKFYDQNTLIGTSASNESLLDSIILKKRFKFLSYLFKKITYRSKFKSFPNPHIRTSSFLINAEIFLDFIDKKKIISKEHTWEIESGRDNLTSYFENNDLKVFVVNSDGNKFANKDWKFSETYNYFQQSKSIISDKHTRKYNTLNIDEKLLSQKKVWGN